MGKWHYIIIQTHTQTHIRLYESIYYVRNLSFLYSKTFNSLNLSWANDINNIHFRISTSLYEVIVLTLEPSTSYL